MIIIYIMKILYFERESKVYFVEILVIIACVDTVCSKYFYSFIIFYDNILSFF